MAERPFGTSDDLPRRWQAEAEYLARHGLYDPAEEHDACGVGLVAAIDGKPRRQVVEAGIAALKAVWHRGAVDADGKTGDGAGIHVQIPQDFFKEHVRRTGHIGEDDRIAVGMVFLPRTDLSAQERCRVVVEREILTYGYTIFGWRQVPVNVEIIGEKAKLFTNVPFSMMSVSGEKALNPRRHSWDVKFSVVVAPGARGVSKR